MLGGGILNVDQVDRANLQHISGVESGLGDWLAVEQDAAGGPHVKHHIMLVDGPDLGMVARYIGIIQNQVVIGMASNIDDGDFEREVGPAANHQEGIGWQLR